MKSKMWYEGCSRKGEMRVGFFWEDLKKRNHMEWQDLYERIILKCVLKIGLERVDWIHLA
jgi:hypothetical protein